MTSTLRAKGANWMIGMGQPHENDQTNILVVDDLPEKHLVYETILHDLGSNVVSVYSGAEALKTILQQDFAVILLDVNMPDMDGFETAKLIRQRKRSASTPIIFLTAFADEVRTAQGYASGAVDYLPTPIVPEILRAKVRVFVDLFQMRRQTARQAEERAKQLATEDANRRLSFLVDAGAVLGCSLDVEATAHDIVSLPVPLLAEVCVLKLNSEFGELRTLIARHGSDVRPSVEGQTEDVSIPVEVSEALGRAMTNTDFELLKNKSGVILPLQGRGRTVAALALFSESNARLYDLNDVTLAEAFASRAAVALDNALLHEEIRSVDRQKNDFLSMLAHELRNPLAPIRNAAKLLELRVPEGSDVKWACNVIDRQIIQMVRLVDDLLDVARITRDKILLHRQPILLSTVIEHAIEASRPEIDSHKHQLSVTLCESPISIDGDLARLTQVFTNLLNNAAKFTQDGGRISVSTNIEGDSAIIRVRDNGIGIPRQMLNSVFNLFTQVDRALDRSTGGLGIGLTLVRRLVEMHEGTVEAQSAGAGSGSEFVVRLPLATMSSKDSTSLTKTSEDQTGIDSRRILVVDDNRDSVQTLSMMLRLMGHETEVATDGLEAIEKARNYQPDVILLDIGLPKLNGYEVCRRIREQSENQNALIVALTGWGQDEDRFKSKEAGFDRHLVKPIELTTLEDLLAS